MALIMLALHLTGAAASPSSETRPSFDAWLADVRREALAQGVSQSTLDTAFKDLAPIPRVIELDRSQPEFALTLEEYLDKVVNQTRILRGREKLAQHRTLLQELAQDYGVQPQFLIALWGIETDFGRLGGSFPVIAATATLAYDGRRGAFFREELLQALRILEQGHVTAERMKGSWAGAMGHFQFMPSSFTHFAVDQDRDGRIDIWEDLGDAFASAANYLAKSGWRRDQSWGLEVKLPADFDRTLVGLQTRRPLSAWQSLGVRRIGGRDLPDDPILSASVVEPDGPGGRAFLVYENYLAILKWNRSHLFAIAVGILADGILAGAEAPTGGR